jgi:hypothetical protein
VLEDFEAYDLQVDSTGLPGGSGMTFHTVLDDLGDLVATVLGDSEVSSSIIQEGANRFWGIDSTTTSGEPLVAVADIPGDPATGLTPTGPFATYFEQPQDLRTNPPTLVCVDLRTGTGTGGETVRIVLGDAQGRFARSEVSLPLGESFETYELVVGVDALDSQAIDLTQIETIGLDFETDSVENQAFAFDVDNMRLIPEPSAVVQTVAVTIAIACLSAWRRQQRRR